MFQCSEWSSGHALANEEHFALRCRFSSNTDHTGSDVYTVKIQMSLHIRLCRAIKHRAYITQLSFHN